MDNTPTNDSRTPTTTQLVPPWQTNSMALKVSRTVDRKRTRAAAVHAITGATY